eukprot:TRINITY_DN5491_c0_g1_i2.p1 TRINITY_DN5491_c0_g1~~TRINITY_DN5491_c0_g1_i2.p1  ORF type:complete len:508 (-),score=98.63 TRINITY_DN5491_c0_g1_i2:454-1812(-)
MAGARLDVTIAQQLCAEAEQDIKRLEQKAERERDRELGRSPKSRPAALYHVGAWMDFLQYHYLTSTLEELTTRNRHASERTLQRELGLDEDDFWRFRNDLVFVHQLISEFDEDEDGLLSRAEVKLLLKRIGLEPFRRNNEQIIDKELNRLIRQKQDSEHGRVRALLRNPSDEDESALNFHLCEILDLIVILRGLQIQSRHPVLQTLFYKTTKGDHQLNIQKVPDILAAESLNVRHDLVNSDQQEVLQHALDEMDTTVFGDIIFPELENLYQKVAEKLRQASAELNARNLPSLLLSTDEMATNQKLYDMMDETMSNQISLTDVKQAISVHFRCVISAEETKNYLSLISHPPENPVSLFDFNRLMARMEDVQRQTPLTLSMMGKKTLLRSAKFFGLSQEYMEQASLTELADVLASFLDMKDAKQDLRTLPEPVYNGRQLVMRSKTKASFSGWPG